MKPKISINSPIFKIARNILNSQVKIAWEAEQIVENAVIPIYIVPKTKAHKKPKTKPIQSGSGVLVNIKDEYFVFSATHVFCDFDDMVLLTSAENNFVEQLSGERFSTGNLENRIDKYDATVFHIKGNISDELKKIAITLDYFDLDGFDSSKPIFMISGFLAKESNTSGNEIKIKAKNFPTIEIDNYQEYNYDRERHILLSYENQILVGNNWQLAPTPRGMSGGAIIKAHGTSILNNKINNNKTKQFLTAITIEQHKDKGDKLGFLVGTRVNVHLGLIYQFYPEVLSELITIK